MEMKDAITGNKLDFFFAILNQLIAKREIKRGKDFRLMEGCNGKVLSLHMESIYASYAKAVGVEAPLLMDIRHMLQNSQFLLMNLKSWISILNDTTLKLNLIL